MSSYLLHGKLTAQPGQREALAGILIQASALVSTAQGCKLYVVGLLPEDSDSVYITEIWDSKADHDASLQVPGVRELIMQAMPLLAGKPEKGQEIEIMGGFGV